MFFHSYRNRGQQPATQKIWSEFSSRMGFGNPEKITLEQISQVSQEILDKHVVTLIPSGQFSAVCRAYRHSGPDFHRDKLQPESREEDWIPGQARNDTE